MPDQFWSAEECAKPMKPFNICPTCAGQETVHYVVSTENRTFKGETFIVPVQYFSCERCKESFQTMEMEDSLVKAREMYWAKTRIARSSD